MSEYPKAIGPNGDILALDAEDEARKLAALEADVKADGSLVAILDSADDDLADVEPRRRGRPRKEQP